MLLLPSRFSFFVFFIRTHCETLKHQGNHSLSPFAKKTPATTTTTTKTLSPDSKLGGAVTVHETIRVKSAAWDAGGNALLYSTLNHVKYALPDGDGGVVRTLDAPLYLQAAAGRVSFF